MREATWKPVRFPLRNWAIRGLVAVSLVASAAGCDCGSKNLAHAGPVIQVAPSSVGPLLGVPGQVISTTLDITNVGTGALVLDPPPKFVQKDGISVSEFAVSSLLELDCTGNERPAADRTTLESGECGRLIFRYLPTADGNHPADLHIYSNDDATPDFVVPINAQAATPTLEVCAYDGSTKIDCATPGNAYRVQFGTAAPGDPVTRTLRLTSVGSTAVQIQNLSLSGDRDFTVTPGQLSTSLAPGKSTDLTASFNAITGGAREADLTIANDDPKNAKLLVRLVATGDASRLCYCIGPSPDGQGCTTSPVADFGQVPINGQGKLYLLLASCGTKPLTLTEAEVTTGGPVFSAQAPSLGSGLVLQPGQSVTPPIPLGFQPPNTASYAGQFTVVTDSEHGYISLEGEGVLSGCDLQAASNVLDFGQVAVGMTLKKPYTVGNRGTKDCILPSPPQITAGANAKFALANTPLPGTLVPPGHTVQFAVSYTPQDAVGPDTGEMSIPYGDAAGGVATNALLVELKGMPTQTPKCVLTALPGAASAFGRMLNFGDVRINTEKVLPITFQDTGSAPCTLGQARVVQGIMPGQPPAPFTVKTQPASTLQPGDTTEVDVAFDPTSEGDFGSPLPGFPGGGAFGASVQIQTSDTTTFDGTECQGFGTPGNPGCAGWALSGSGVVSDLIVLPSDIDFGTVTLGCDSPEQTVTLYNVGNSSISVTGFKIDPAPPPAIFTVVSPTNPPPSGPTITIPAGGKQPITIRFQPAATGEVSGDLYVQSNAAGAGGANNPYTTVSLKGNGTTDSSQTDVFKQPDRPIADVLWVIDMDSDSMSDKQQALAQNAQAFIAAAQQDGTDYHLGVISNYLGGNLKTNCGGNGSPFGGPTGCTSGSSFNNVTIQPGVLYHDNGARAWVERTDANPVQEFANEAQIGVSSDVTGNETGLEAMYRALSDPLVNDPKSNQGFLRPDARLVVISISDDDDFSNKDPDFYAAFLESLKPNEPDQVTFDAVGGDMPGGCTNGVDGDAPTRFDEVVQKTGGKLYSICNGDYSTIAADLSLGSFGGQTRWVLSRPCNPNTLTVTVNGTPVAAGSGYTFDASSNSITLATAPPPGATITATYGTVCL